MVLLKVAWELTNYLLDTELPPHSVWHLANAKQRYMYAAATGNVEGVLRAVAQTLTAQGAELGGSYAKEVS